MTWLAILVALLILSPLIARGLTGYAVRRQEDWTREGGWQKW